MADMGDFLEVGRHDDDRQTRLERPGDQPIDVGLGADIDACGRIFGDQQLAASCKPAADNHLLLVAARQRLDRQALVVRPQVRRFRRSCAPGTASLNGDRNESRACGRTLPD